MSKKLIVANWKMNMPNLRGWRNFRAPSGVEVVICPPFPYLSIVKGQLLSVTLGAENVFWEESGAYTGEVSPTMLKNSGVRHVIIGHSERRRWLGETDEMVNKKILAALRAGLKVILCVGEPLAIRRRGLPAAKKYVARQLAADLKGTIELSSYRAIELIIAYEPLWAIGTGRADNPEETVEMSRFVKGLLATRYSLLAKVLYGGSVNSKNIRDFVQYKEIDGALVGGASLKAEEFKKIVDIVSKL